MSDKIREAFEAWFNDTVESIERNYAPYTISTMRSAKELHWISWQAAVAQQPAPVFVPDRLTYSQGDRRYVDGWNDALSHITAPPADEQPYSTTSDKYRAELYDEVWEKARDMGYGNVTMALAELERMKAATEQPDTVKVSRELLTRHLNEIGEYAWDTYDEMRALLAGGDKP